MKNLLKHLARRHALFLGVSAAVLAGFEFVICAVVSTIDVPALFAELMKIVPPLMRSSIEQVIGGAGPADLVAFGWNHPIALAMGGAAAIVLAARAVAGEIETGTLELVLSHPLSREAYFAGQVIFAAAGLAALVFCGALGTLVGERLYGLQALGPGTLALLAVNFFLLQSAWFGVTLLVSVFGREAGRVAFTGFLVALISYLVQVIAQIWPAAAFLLPFSPNAYYEPRAIVRSGALPAKSIAVLGGLAVLSIGISLWRFRRRDIP